MPRSFLVKKVKHPVDHSNRWPYHETSHDPSTTPPGFTIHYTNVKFGRNQICRFTQIWTNWMDETWQMILSPDSDLESNPSKV
ncbi:hypothetical protein AVEN_20451-1 [Araneus ventricosus]|uniref:Uncharacterized protein n=1 Tax=Araneus ventricosus TaxID=182803 RepID=A0A4Y2QV53_ARAVE|nr:hypothetical protein AVEN_20451-1 [Araneus ventricosus]